MEFLEYATKTQSNIIPKENFEKLVQEVFNVISDNLCKSLGPLGSSATILEGMTTDATKDGYSILRKYRFHNRYKKMIYNLILGPCTRMNNTVGDGTTTAIALTTALFNRYNEKKNYLETLYRLPREFTKAWDDIINEICNRIDEKATPLDPENYEMIYNLAYVVSNGNEEVSRNIAEVYKEAKSPSIKEKDSPTNKSYIKPINGYDFPANMISDAYVKNEDLTSEEANVFTMVFNFKIETDFFKNVIIPINDISRAMGHKLIIVAPFYDAYMCQTIVDQYINMEFRTKGSINLILVQYESGKLEKNQLDDLAVILRSKVINQELANTLLEEISTKVPERVVESILEDSTSKVYRFIGTAADVILSCNTGSIFKVKDIEKDDKYNEVLLKAKKDLDDVINQTDKERQAYASKIYNAKRRVMQLEMKNYIYYIGADSTLQKNITWDTVEDVIKCLRSAIKSGVVPGCQLVIINICSELIKEITDRYKDDDNKKKLYGTILEIISGAILDVYYRVLSGPDGMGIVKTISRWQYTTEDGIDELKKEAIEKTEKIISESVEKNQVFDIEKLECSSSIITSAETDKMVLSAASDLIKILITGNQCIVLDSDVDETHEDNVEVYV